MGGMPGGMGGMPGGMGGMEDILKNMGGMGGMPGGAAGGAPGGMGGMGGMGDMLGKMMSNPKAMALMQKAQSNPKIMKALQDVQANGPSAMQKYQNDPEGESRAARTQRSGGACCTHTHTHFTDHSRIFLCLGSHGCCQGAARDHGLSALRWLEAGHARSLHRGCTLPPNLCVERLSLSGGRRQLTASFVAITVEYDCGGLDAHGVTTGFEVERSAERGDTKGQRPATTDIDSA
jgi:hypothetical protein